MCTTMQNNETPFCPRLKMTERFFPVPQGHLNKLSGGGSLRGLLVQLLKKMLVVYKERLKKESRQSEYYRQLRILNP